MVGDLWFTRPKKPGTLGRITRWAITLLKFGLHTRYTHVMVEAGRRGDHALVLSADPGGVVFKSTAYLNSKEWEWEVRQLQSLTPQLRDKLYNRAIRLKGKRYGFSTLFAHLIGWRAANWMASRDDRDFICSEVAGEVYDAINYRFHKRHSDVILPPGGLRPRDVEWSTRPEISSGWQRISSHRG